MTIDASRTISLRVSEADYLKLKVEAAALGLRPAVLARVIVRASLNAAPGRLVRTSRHQFLTALEGLNQLVEAGGGAPVDAVAVVNTARARRAADLGSDAVTPPIM